MVKKMILVSLGVILVLAIVLMASTSDKLEVTRVKGGAVESPLVSKGPCSLTKTSGILASYNEGISVGDRVCTYFDPGTCPQQPTYPFEITDFGFTLHDDGNDIWPAQVDIVIYDTTTYPWLGLGPGTELYRFSVTADQGSYMYPSVGTFVFPPGECCLTGPFFIGLEHTGGVPGSIPTICYDDSYPIDSCENWVHLSMTGTWYEWHIIWTPPAPGYPIFLVNGETSSQNCPEICDWQQGDPYKHHFPQLPDETGWAVNATNPVVLAEDFMCMESGPIKDYHIWGGWRNDDVGDILSFNLRFYDNIPASQNPDGYSKPGSLIGECEISDFDIVEFFPPTMEGWYDPSIGEIIFDDHYYYFQYNICLPDSCWFMQDSGSVYWVMLTANVSDPEFTQWGWKSTQDHWNDNAVWAPYGDQEELTWNDTWEPADPQTNMFWIGLDQTSSLLPELSGGVGFYGDGISGTGWFPYNQETWDFYNIWFYDHPLDYNRAKNVHIEFDVSVFDPDIPTSWLTFVVNYATDVWTLQQPPGDSIPPLPPLSMEDELLYIGRDTLYDGPVSVDEHFIFDWDMMDYNPEWISIDVAGSNFVIENGTIIHDCVGPLDLSLVVTGGVAQSQSGACCYEEENCSYTTQSNCEEALGGEYQGDGVLCDRNPCDQSCCLLRGDALHDNQLILVNDLVFLVNYVFKGGPAPFCLEEGDALADNGLILVNDLVFLVNYVFKGGTPPAACP